MTRVCRRLNAAFPDSLEHIDRREEKLVIPRHVARNFDRAQLRSVARWMRVSDCIELALDFHCAAFKLLTCDNHGFGCWLRLNFSFSGAPMYAEVDHTYTCLRDGRIVRHPELAACMGWDPAVYSDVPDDWDTLAGCDPFELLRVPPHAITALGNLNVRALDLSGKKITDDHARLLVNVHTLNLCGTEITDVGAALLRNVHTLNLCGTEITDVGAAFLGNVHTLDLSSTKITDVGAAFLGNVHTLSLSCNEKITDVGAAALGKVHTLSLCHNEEITDVGAAFLGNVHTLNLSCTEITDVGAAFLGNVHTLDLSNNWKITDVGAAALGNVHTLNVSHNWRITDVGARLLGNVHTLNLSHTAITDFGIVALGNVHTLDISETRVTDVGGAALIALGKFHALTLDSSTQRASSARLSVSMTWHMHWSRVIRMIQMAVLVVACFLFFSFCAPPKRRTFGT